MRFKKALTVEVIGLVLLLVPVFSQAQYNPKAVQVEIATNTEKSVPRNTNLTGQQALNYQVSTGSLIAAEGGGVGGVSNSFWFELSYTNVVVRTNGLKSHYVLTNQDALVVSNTYYKAWDDKQALVVPSQGLASVVFSSTVPTVAVVDTNGYMKRVSDGVTTLIATTSSCTQRVQNIEFAISTATELIWSNGMAGSLRKHITDTIDTRLVSGKSMEIYSSFDHTTTNYVRNVKCWAYGLDIACVPVWHSAWTNMPGYEVRRGGILISPRHALTATHAGYNLYVGEKVRWVTTNNVVEERTVAAVTNLDTDLSVALLDSAITNITFARVLPGGWTNYFGRYVEYVSNRQGMTNMMQFAREVPEIEFTAARGPWAMVFNASRIWGVGSWPVWQPAWWYFVNMGTLRSGSYRVNPQPWRVPFSFELISGDSGQPAIWIINNLPVVLATHTMSYGGHSIAYEAENIRGAMVGLGGGYTLTTLNLSGFDQYP
jgi:hypothetical protein